MHSFIGKWISDGEFCALEPRDVFHRHLEPKELPCDEHRNRHILFRRKFSINRKATKAQVYISADDYYKLYINGSFVAQGPAPSYHSAYNYNVIDVTEYLTAGENLIAVHTLYQGLINRVWQSGDNRHGLILDLELDGEIVVSSDESFLTARHTAYREIGTAGYETQFLEEYDSRAREVGFEKPDFDDSAWERAGICLYDDHTMKAQESKMLVFEQISPKIMKKTEGTLFLDFGSNYVGYLYIRASGRSGDAVTVRCAQELNDDGSIRYALRANCKYEETWILADGESTLDQFDYKSFRYAELTLPDGCELHDIHFIARHYPFELRTRLLPEYASDERLQNIWKLCVNTQKYGVQEVIQDCMEREKGFYVGDGCYTALTNAILTLDDSMVRKLIDDGFSASFITDGLVTCLDCSFMQEIAEYPLMLIYLVLWHYRLFDDREYLAKNYPKIVKLLDAYRRDYESDGLLSELDKWCVVEWPANFRDGYAVDLTERQICHEAHVSINSYYIEAIRTANKIAAELGVEPYRDETPLYNAFLDAFYDKERCLFTDGINNDHVSFIGNVTAFGLGMCPDEKSRNNIIKMIDERKISSVSLFGAYLLLMGCVRFGASDRIGEIMLDRGAWLRMLAEDATTTFEGWGKDTKWNTSLFHLTMSYGAMFLADIDLEALLK
ncbi:MAG: family 78 glycoside hydrolase catalytic domain [Clostridia bacterium]|nr:family 78 glycoside hydrolase catalytic domain [Clostridia bacterium]